MLLQKREDQKGRALANCLFNKNLKYARHGEVAARSLFTVRVAHEEVQTDSAMTNIRTVQFMGRIQCGEVD